MDWQSLGSKATWFTTAFSVAAFSISLFTFYYNYVEGPDLSVSVARTLSFRAEQ